MVYHYRFKLFFIICILLSTLYVVLHTISLNLSSFHIRSRLETGTTGVTGLMSHFLSSVEKTNYSLHHWNNLVFDPRAQPKKVAISPTNARPVPKTEPKIFAITPTYARAVQKAELTRLLNTFLHITNFHWILVEDSANKTNLVSNFLEGSGLNYSHLNVETSLKYKAGKNESATSKPRGVEQRNIGIDWLLENTNADEHGVVYFADDDNTYSLRLFEEMRHTKNVSVWPVGLSGGRRFETPIVNAEDHVTGWNAWYSKGRKFATDMAGFAVNLKLFHKKADVRFNITAPLGYLETRLLEKLVALEDLEPKAERCTKIYVWHTKTQQPKWPEVNSNDSYMEV
ncbi:galactosylgalactosylxylosylprotein 3-beta-glucuronosyltransferase 1-like [Amphiura filiformis]|uniref:galactosylgalactosylxylosylprotein 3-beta-glucuronosyltransferase 1-like n=1 Tax=Amphiura filiformis TaxID=82378 RepID=UPI003B21C1EB